MKAAWENDLIDLPRPALRDVLDARREIAPHLHATPLYRFPALERLTATETWVKLENHQPTGTFKVRGGVNLVSRLSEPERAAGVIAASTGNHGQSVAFAASRFGVKATICVPDGANPVKLQAIKDLGAEVLELGHDYDAAREHCEDLAKREGYRYIHSGDEPLLISGVATYTLEILEQEPDTEVIVVPIGGGSGAAGTCIVAKGINPEVEVIGVQSDQAPAAFHSWHQKALLTDENRTQAEGLATRTSFALPQQILWDLLDDFVLVSEDELFEATFHMIENTRNLVELSGAAPLAAARSIKERLAGKKVVLISSGGNISPEQLEKVLGFRP